MNPVKMQPFNLAGKTFQSRLIMGTSLYANRQLMLDALKTSATEIVTLSIRRVDLSGQVSSLPNILKDQYQFLPNTAGCRTAADAILTAQLSREALKTNWIKLEVIGDEQTLFPDVEETLQAADQLIQDGFQVLAYTNDDPVTCQKLALMGCAAVMPLAAPIGSGGGIRNPHNLKIIRQLISVPMIVDAGIGTASDAALAMELGADAILLNSAVAKAENPVAMAAAMAKAVEAGYLARQAIRMPERLIGSASSPTEGRIQT